MNRQTLVEKFNEEYIKATRTSDPQHYHRSTLIARQLVDLMGQEGIVVDNFDEELLRQEG